MIQVRPLFLLLGCLALDAFGQGMGSPAKAVSRPSSKVKIGLASPRFQAREIAASAGIAHTDVHGGVKSNKYILEMSGHGAAVIDFDNDGGRDLFFVNGTRIGASAPAPH